MILVAGGTGRLGARVVELLRARGDAVRVLTRDPARAAALGVGIDVVRGDARDAEALAVAVSACRAVISAFHGFTEKDGPERIDRDANRALVRAAADARVEHVVLLSVQGASPDHPMSLHRAKWAAEEALRASGLRFTIVRPTAFLETWMSVIGGPIDGKGHALVLGPGKNPVNFVSLRDVAALVVLALRERALWNEAVDVGGPEDIPFVTFAERMLAARGKPPRIKHVPLPMLRAMSVLARPVSPTFARQARAAVVMNTRDMSFDDRVRARFPEIPSTALGDLLAAAAPAS